MKRVSGKASTLKLGFFTTCVVLAPVSAFALDSGLAGFPGLPPDPSTPAFAIPRKNSSPAIETVAPGAPVVPSVSSAPNAATPPSAPAAPGTPAAFQNSTPRPDAASAPAQRRERALVLAGGGVNPGFSLGLIAGARAGGYRPDVIVATCGGSLGASIDHAYPTDAARLAYITSPQFHKLLQDYTQIDTAWAPDLMAKLDAAEQNPSVLPALTHGNVLKIPENATHLLPPVGRIRPDESFRADPTGKRARLVILGAKAEFDPNHEGTSKGKGPLFKQVYFTDPETGKLLEGMPSPIKKLFPRSHVDPDTSVITDKTVAQAMRASIADPFLANPSRIGKDYYFTGAIDLHPIETAQKLAKQVMITYPSTRYGHYEDLAVSSAFGFSQSERSRKAARQTGVRWIDTSGADKLGFDPDNMLLWMKSYVPADYPTFAGRIRQQYQLGYERGLEAARLQKNVGNVRSFLREPRDDLAPARTPASTAAPVDSLNAR